MIELAVASGLLLLLLCTSIALLRSARSGRVTLLDWTLLGIGGIYGAGWVLVILVTEQGGNPSWARWILPFDRFFPLHTVSALILGSAIYAGWLLMGCIKINIGSESKVQKRSNHERLSKAAWVLLICAFVLQWAYMRAYGGFLGLLEYSALIRSGLSDVTNPLSFLRPFGGLTLFASFLFFGLWIGGHRRIGLKIGFMLSCAFSLYILLSWLGRMGFLMYAASFALGTLLARQVRPIPLLLGGGLMMLALLFAGYQLSVLLGIKGADSLVQFLARELSFPFVSFFVQFDRGEHLFRGFLDLLLAPVYLLPSSWWTSWVQDVGQINTALIMGAPKGELGVTGAIPIDLLTLGLMQAGAAGILGIGMVFGALLRLAQSVLDRVKNTGVRAIFEAYVVVRIAVFTVFYAQPELVVSGNVALLFSIFVVLICIKMPRLRILRRTGYADDARRSEA